MINIQHLPSKEIIKGYRAKFVHTEQVTFAFWEVEQGAILPSHQHVHEQSTQVLEGAYELTIDGETQVYTPGMIAIIPPNVPHNGVALTVCKLMDVFSPCREDYK